MERDGLPGHDPRLSQSEKHSARARQLSVWWSLERDGFLTRGLREHGRYGGGRGIARHGRLRPCAPSFRTPRLLVAIELSLGAVLDLTNGATRARLGLTLGALKEGDWRKMQEEKRESLTQKIGRAVFSEEGEGLLVPSARVPDGVNLVYFRENHRHASRVKVLESEKLDRLRSV